MKAAVYKSYGAPNVLEIKEVETPTPKDDEVLIRVYASTVNRTDCAMLRAKPFIMRFFTGLFKPRNPILGTDFSGKIEAVGKAVSKFNIGDRVFGFEDQGLSSHAEYMVLSADKGIALIPPHITFVEAACIEGAHYAYNFVNKVNIKKGAKILVNGASGGIGIAAVQLLKYYEADVTAVCNTKNLELVKSIGADRVMDYTKEDFPTCGQKFDFVFDTVGKSTFRKCKPLLNVGGVYISSELGPMWQNPFYALFTPLLRGKKVIFPIPSDCIRSVFLIQQLMIEGKYKSVIDRYYPLEKIADAYRYVEQGEKTGNVVINLLDG